MAHVLLFPFPAQGHIPPMLNLAELLSHAGVYVTILNTDHIHARISRTSKAVERLSLVPRVRFRSIPDGLQEEDPRTFFQLFDLEETMRTKCRERYREILVSADGQEIGAWPPVTCVVADGFLPLGLEVAEEMQIPTMILRTSSACSVWAYYSIPELIKRGELPFEDDGTDLGKAIHGVAGMESFLRRRDLPSFIREAKSTDDRLLKFVMNISTNLTRANAIILNTVESIEAPVLSHIRSVCPKTYTVGPLHTLIKTVSHHNPKERDAVKPSTSASLWQEDRTCLAWLDSQPPKSVAYVSFGSITIMSREDLLEFWHGLVNSGHPFLWVVRPDLVQEGTTASASEKPPPQLEEATKARGYLVAWAPQQEVLAHPAVGCFLTHSGWNSTMESMVAGVPMICWPFVADQLINSRYVSEVWRIGMDMKDMHGGNVVEMMVREVMDGKRADEMKRLAVEMAEMARESVKEQGSSYQDLQRLIHHIKSIGAQNKLMEEEVSTK